MKRAKRAQGVRSGADGAGESLMLAVLGAGSWSGVYRRSARGGALDPRIVKLVASVSEERLQQLLQEARRASRRATRCRITTSPTRGIGAARQWILDEMKRTSPKLQVSFDTYTIPAAGPHHARRRAAQRDGGAAGQEPAADLRQRPLRLAQPRRQRAADQQRGPGSRAPAGPGPRPRRRPDRRRRDPDAGCARQARRAADPQQRPGQNYNLARPARTTTAAARC